MKAPINLRVENDPYPHQEPGRYERRAWTQGKYTRDERCFCALGAILAAEGHIRSDDSVLDPGESPACGALAVAVSGEAFPFMVARWNDAPGRTQAEVVAALRQAAKDSTQ